MTVYGQMEKVRLDDVSSLDVRFNISYIPIELSAQEALTKLRFIEGNRDHIETRSVDAFKRKFAAGVNFLPYDTIKISKYGIIHDGQHRTLAALDLGIPVWCTVIPDEYVDMKYTSESQTGKSWTIEDYIAYKASEKDPIVLEYLEFLKKTRSEFPDITDYTVRVMFFARQSNLKKGEPAKKNEYCEDILNAVRASRNLDKLAGYSLDSIYVSALKRFIKSVGRENVDYMLRRLNNKFKNPSAELLLSTTNVLNLTKNMKIAMY